MLVLVEKPEKPGVSKLIAMREIHEPGFTHTYPLVDVICCFGGGRLHSRHTWQPDLLVHRKRCWYISVKVSLAENDAKGSSVFDRHTGALTLMGHHLSCVSARMTVRGVLQQTGCPASPNKQILLRVRYGYGSLSTCQYCFRQVAEDQRLTGPIASKA